MSEGHLSDAELRRLLAAAADTGALQAHVDGCAPCRARAWELADIVGRVDGLRASLALEEQPEHLDFETLAQLADGTIGVIESEIAQAHLEDCNVCRAELADLRGFSTGFRQRHRNRHAPGRRLRLAWAAAAVVIMAAGAIWRSGMPAPPGPPPPAVEIPNTGIEEEPPPADRVLVLRDVSGPIERLADGSLTGLPDDRARAMVAAVLGGAAIVLPSVVAELRADRGQLRGEAGEEPASVALGFPVGRVSEDATPRFVWQGPPGVYQVEIFDTDLRAVASGRTAGNSWTPPLALARGRTYLWQLRVFDRAANTTFPQPPDPPARFYVLDEGALEEVASARASRSHLVLGLVLAHHGLIEESALELERLAALNPQAELPRRLLTDLARAR